jgi:hypothetical protein
VSEFMPAQAANPARLKLFNRGKMQNTPTVAKPLAPTPFPCGLSNKVRE